MVQIHVDLHQLLSEWPPHVSEHPLIMMEDKSGRVHRRVPPTLNVAEGGEADSVIPHRCATRGHLSLLSPLGMVVLQPLQLLAKTLSGIFCFSGLQHSRMDNYSHKAPLQHPPPRRKGNALIHSTATGWQWTDKYYRHHNLQ